MTNLNNNNLKATAWIMAGILLVQATLGFEITEIMYNPQGSDTGREWVEILVYPMDNLSQARLVDHAGSHIINFYSGEEVFQGRAVITSNAASFLQEYPDYAGTLFQSAISLSNTGETINLTKNGELLDSVLYTTSFANGNGKTLEKVQYTWQESLELGGTPGIDAPEEVPEFSLIAASIAGIGALLGFAIFRRR